MNITKEAKKRALKVTKIGGGWGCDGLPEPEDSDYYARCRDAESRWGDPSPWAQHALKFWQGRFICLECQKDYLVEDLENAPTLEDVLAVIDKEDPLALMSKEQKHWHNNLNIFIVRRHSTNLRQYKVSMSAADDSWQMQDRLRLRNIDRSL